MPFEVAITIIPKTVVANVADFEVLAIQTKLSAVFKLVHSNIKPLYFFFALRFFFQVSKFSFEIIIGVYETIGDLHLFL